MKVIKPYFVIEDDINGDEILKRLERAGRTCYKSEDKITSDSAKKFVATIIKSGHTSVIEHEKVSVRIICDRGVTHEIVRHRIGSYSQESTRYCNYSKDKHDKQLTFIDPCFWEKDSIEYGRWEDACAFVENVYLGMIELGASPQQARSVLPNSLKTEIVCTLNMRSWINFFQQRTSSAAHPQMREIAIPLLEEFKQNIPVIFDGIEVK